MPNEPEQTPPEKAPPPSVDDLIAQANAQTYVFERQQQRRSLKQWFLDLSKTRKILLIGSTVFLLFTVGVIALTVTSGGNGSLSSSQNSGVATTDINGDGVIDENDNSDDVIEGDTNGDGVIDSRDDVSANTTDSDSAAWWSSLFAKAQGALHSNSKDTPGNSSSSEYSYSEDEAKENAYDDAASDEDYPELDDEDNTDTNIPTNTSSSVNLTLGSWNVYLANKKDVPGNIKSILKNVDTLGIQEAAKFGDAIAKKIACSSCAYGMYPTGKGTPKKVAILWNKSKFTLLSSGFKALSTQDGKKKYVVWVKLRDKSSQKVFYVLNSHYPFNATTTKGTLQNDADGRAYKTHMENMVRKVRELQKQGLPIFLTGDINADYRTDKCTAQALPCRSLSRDLDMKSGWEYMKLKGMGKTTGTASSTRIIDYVFSYVKDYITYKAMDIIYGGKGKGWGGSDHKPIALKLTIGKTSN